MEPILVQTIIVPRPRSVRDPNRPVSSLLLAQVKHLREAEKSLPSKYQSGIFSYAVQTEGEAARYVRAVTEAIHAALDDAAAQRVRKAPKRKRVIEIAAVADEAEDAIQFQGEKEKRQELGCRRQSCVGLWLCSVWRRERRSRKIRKIRRRACCMPNCGARASV